MPQAQAQGQLIEMVRPQAKPAAAPLDFGAALAAVKINKPAAAKKGHIPSLAATPEVKDAVDAYQDAKTAFKKAEASMDSAASILTAFVRENQDREGFRGNYSNSYALEGNRQTAKVIYANKFSINGADEPELKALLGDKFATLILKTPSVKLKAEVFDSPDLQAELMELVGDRFGVFFEATVSLKVAEEFDRDIYRIVTAEKLPELRIFARQNKPSIR